METLPSDKPSIAEIKAMTGETRASMPFVPILQVNNSVKDQDDQEIQTFLITEKDGARYDTKAFSHEFSAIILLHRAQIQKKYKPPASPPA